MPHCTSSIRPSAPATAMPSAPRSGSTTSDPMSSMIDPVVESRAFRMRLSSPRVDKVDLRAVLYLILAKVVGAEEVQPGRTARQRVGLGHVGHRLLHFRDVVEVDPDGDAEDRDAEGSVHLRPRHHCCVDVLVEVLARQRPVGGGHGPGVDRHRGAALGSIDPAPCERRAARRCGSRGASGEAPRPSPGS